MDEDHQIEKDAEKQAEPKNEPKIFDVPNLTRVLPAQAGILSFENQTRFRPVKPLSTSTSAGSKSPANVGGAASAKSAGKRSQAFAPSLGIVVLLDNSPQEKTDYLELEEAPAAGPPAPPGNDDQAADADLSSGPIAAMPAPFQWTDWE